MSVPDCFSIGSIVEVRTCYNDVIEGQVIGFDLHEKLLILSKLFTCLMLLFLHSELSLMYQATVQ